MPASKWDIVEEGFNSVASTIVGTIGGPFPETPTGQSNSLYRPLKDGNFRLARVFPCPWNCSQLSCSIKNVTLSAAGGPDEYLYTAISYTWGSNVKDHYLLWFNQRIWVTKSCYEACDRYARRLPIALRAPVYWIWIDQLCIDQTNLGERSGQVQLMGDIYKRANRVLIWLQDPDTIEISTAEQQQDLAELDMLEGICERLNQSSSTSYALQRHSNRRWSSQEVCLFKGLLLCLGISLYNRKDPTSAKERGVNKVLDKEEFLRQEAYYENIFQIQLKGILKDLDKLLRNATAWCGLGAIMKRLNPSTAYFRRRWIIQEASVQHAENHCYMGNFEFPLTNFLDGLWKIGQLPRSTPKYNPLAKLTSVETVLRFLGESRLEMQQAWTMTAIKQYSLATTSIQALPYLLDNCPTSASKEDNDVFYAIHSLMDRFAPPQRAGAPIPDYTLPTQTVLRQYISYLLETGNGPSMIQRSGLQNGSQRLDGLPSWYPAWFVSDFKQRPRRYILDLTSNLESCSVYHGYNHRAKGLRWQDIRRSVLAIHADRRLTPNLKWDADATTISLRGILIGKVVDKFPSLHKSGWRHILTAIQHDADQVELSDEYIDFIHQHTKVTGVTSVWTEHWNRMLQESMTSLVDLPDEEEGRCGLHRYLQAFLHEPMLGHTTCSGAVEIEDILNERQLLAVSIDLALASAFLDQGHQLQLHNMAALSIVGIGPCRAQADDCVVVFDGFATPMVLRLTQKIANAPSKNIQSPGLTNSQRFEVIGDAYIMQLANGNVMSHVEDSKSREFVLI